MRRRREPNLGLLSPPGGKLEAGETPEEGVIREVREETGLVPLRVEFRGTAHHFGPGPDEEWLQFLFLVDEFEGTAHATHAEGELAWLPIDALLRGELPIPAADPLYHATVLDRRRPPGSWRIFHRPDGSVDRFEEGTAP